MPDLQEAGPGPSRSPRARRQVFNSLSTRIIFFVFMSTFLSALVVSWISIHAIHSQLRAELDRRFPAILEVRIEALSSLIEQFEAHARAAAHDARLESEMARSNPRQGRLVKILEERLEWMPDFDALLVLDDRGVPVSSVGPIDDATRAGAVRAVAGAAPGETHLAITLADARGGSMDVALLVPIGPTDSPHGWIAARHHVDRFAATLVATAHEGSARLALVAADGRVVATSDQAFRPEVSTDRLARIADGRVHEYTTSTQAHVLGAARPMPHGHWTLLVEAPFDVAFAPVLAVVSRIFISDLVIILVFSFLAYKITAAIMRPIRALSEGARRISRGDFDHAIPDVRANDEIGLLIRTFNDMLAQLRRNSTEIEDDQRRLTDQNEELQRANEVLAQLSITDGLTKLHNHRYFQDHLTREIKRIGRTGEPLSIILMDLDDFKRLNDLYGHSAGDELLVGVANILMESVRESDLLARYGGEEFVILATGTTHEGAISMAEKIRMSVEGSSHIVDDSMRPIRVTLSIGVATYEGDRRAFFQAADRALYDAKAQGKNCVVAAPPTGEPPPA